MSKKKDDKKRMASKAIRHRGPKGLVGLMGLTILIGLMGCSASDEEAEQPSAPSGLTTPIAFAAQQGEEEVVTRSTPLEETNEEFVVWGYKNVSGPENPQEVMPAYTVRWMESTANTTTSNTHDWEYVGLGEDQTIKYWDWSAEAYRFFATTSYNSSSVPENAEDYEADGAYGEYNTTYGTYELTMLADGTTAAGRAATPYYSKLWYSDNSVAGRLYGHSVQLTFVQPFTRVRFMFVQSIPDAVIMLSDKRFGPTDTDKEITTKGIYKVSYPLTGAQTEEEYSVVSSTDAITAMTEEYYETPNDAGARRWYTVLPCTGQGSYTLSVKVNGVEKSVVVPAEYMDWLPGYEKTYIFKITDEGGVEIDLVQSAFTNWTYMSTNHTVYNW